MNALHGVRRTPEGFVPYCRTCGYEGKARPADLATAAASQHRFSARHLRECRLAAIGRSRT